MSRRDFGASSFGSGSCCDEEDADPRIGLVNLADVMLVFACGLMLALVSRWGVNLSTVEEMDSSNMQEIEDVQSMIDEMQSGGGGYDERGKVYQDPETGTLYLLEPEETGQGESDGSAGEDGSANGAANEESSAGEEGSAD